MDRELAEAYAAAHRFPALGERLSLRLLSGGHIHRTYLAETDAGERFILQRVNREVFPRPEANLANLDALRAFLDSRADGLYLPRYLPDREGSRLSGGGTGGCWRLCGYAEHSRSLPRAENPEQLFQAALAFGRFLHAFRDFPAVTLTEATPRFHDTPDRYRLLREAAEADPVGRLPGMRAELDFVRAREERAGELTAALRGGKLPPRVIHGDTHFSNVLFCEKGDAALCVIDFDTVMPGLSAWDFGDLVRSCAAVEEEGNARFSPERYRVLLRGFWEGCPKLSREERDALPLGAWTMTLESGVRYLTDYLSGDRVFRAWEPEQNLHRARRQLSLLASMERQWDEMCGEA